VIGELHIQTPFSNWMQRMMMQTKYFSTLNIFMHSAVVKSKMKSLSIW